MGWFSLFFLRDLCVNAWSIALFLIGVVFVTMFVVVFVVHEVIGFGWVEFFVLGAIVLFIDAVVPVEIMRRVGVLRCLFMIVEGENLINDWMVFVFYKFVVVAVVIGLFLLVEVSWCFVLSGLGGLVVGFAVGWVICQVCSWIDDLLIEITIFILFGYVVYFFAEQFDLFGVIVAVIVGIYMGWYILELIMAVMRIQGTLVWEILIFLLNVLLFLLVGLQLFGVFDDIFGYAVVELIRWGLFVSFVVVGVRLVWGFTVFYLLCAIDRCWLVCARCSLARECFVISWVGMRGLVSLAAVLAVLLEIDGGGLFPNRELIILLVFVVILVTLVGQGLILGPFINRLGVCDDGVEEREEIFVWLCLAEAVLACFEEIRGEDWVREDMLECVRGVFDYWCRRFDAQTDGDGGEYEECTGVYVRLMYELFDAQREELLGLCNCYEISDEVRCKVERDLDLEELWLAF